MELARNSVIQTVPACHQWVSAGTFQKYGGAQRYLQHHASAGSAVIPGQETPGHAHPTSTYLPDLSDPKTGTKYLYTPKTPSQSGRHGRAPTR